MKIPKEQILEVLRGQGDHDKASQAETQLPDQLDTDQDSGMLEELGLDANDLMSKARGTIPGM